MSFLPILSSSFLNASLLSSATAPMDEPPFIDTDVGTQHAQQPSHLLPSTGVARCARRTGCFACRDCCLWCTLARAGRATMLLTLEDFAFFTA
eukprot:1017636-Prymnesium_polylepis.1